MCSLPVPREPLRRVAVTGGTHGNEMCGVHLVRHWLQTPGELQRPSFSAMPVLANPAATAACRRYIDRDLNRTFTLTFLKGLPPAGTPDSLELSNQGRELQNPGLSCHFLQYDPAGTGSYSLESVSKNGICLEMGPQPQGVLRADLFSRMRALVASILDFIELFNQGMAFPAFEMDIYRTVDSVDFPRTADGDLAGTVHPQLQDHDFEPLRPGEPIFKLFSGEDVLYEGNSIVYPVFINEAAYYEKHVAFLKTEKIRVSVPALPEITSTLVP
ncbi:hypothetical protein A6R68_12556 [Neotoma lepida]|uniref:N-acyl-aromatic-L-amino acid amidohydrolase n=1 Tax=Neotoma lepida TaxID=56216 RepID=A0A1A6H2S4_NEOLE|nr:hypothetical protein A6R68_12556 [Neotoma lepida]